MTLTPERRRQILDEVFRYEAEYAAIYASPHPSGNPRIDELLDLLDPLMEEYRRDLPWVPLSRCPFCLEIVTYPFDPYGLDGLWWWFERSSRGSVMEMCPHFFCFTGALKTRPPIENPPFAIEPGPEVPFVVPRLLAPPAVRVVIGSVAVGQHTGYPIFYFGDPVPEGIKRLYDWAKNSAGVYLDGHRKGWGGEYPLHDDLDYDLAPWIEQGRLEYILPGDDTMTLRRDVAGCPYLDLPGRREWMIIFNGVAT